MTEWEDSYKHVKKEFEEHDVSSGIAMAMSVKDDEEQARSLRRFAYSEIYSNSK